LGKNKKSPTKRANFPKKIIIRKGQQNPRIRRDMEKGIF